MTKVKKHRAQPTWSKSDLTSPEHVDSCGTNTVQLKAILAHKIMQCILLCF